MVSLHKIFYLSNFLSVFSSYFTSIQFYFILLNIVDKIDKTSSGISFSVDGLDNFIKFEENSRKFVQFDAIRIN